MPTRRRLNLHNPARDDRRLTSGGDYPPGTKPFLRQKAEPKSGTFRSGVWKPFRSGESR